MSTPLLSDLLVAKTADQWMTLALAQLGGKGFPTTDWGTTAPERAMLETDTACLADQSTQIPLIVQLVLVAYSTGDALRFLAHHWYEIDYFPATATIGNVLLSCSSLAGPYTIAVNQLIAKSANGILYTNVTGTSGALASGGTATLSFQAQSPGVAGNVGNGTILTLLTPLPGVTINNVPPTYSVITHTGSGTGTLTLTGAGVAGHTVIVRIDTSGQSGAATWSTSLDGAAYSSHGAAASIANLGGFAINIALTNGVANPSFIIGDLYQFATPGTWITTQGTDIESDANLKSRILARWPSLSAIPTTDVYSLWARQAIPGQVTRVLSETNPAVAATVDIYCAGPAAPVTAAQVNAIQAYIDVRHPITDIPVVHAAATTAITITGAASYPAGSTGIPADRNAAINAYVNGVGLSTATGGDTVEIAEIIALALNLTTTGVPQGATNITGVQLNGGGSDITLSAHNVATLTNSIVWTGV